MYALLMVLHLGSIIGSAETLQRLTQPLFAPLLLAALLTAVTRVDRTTVMLAIGLLAATAGDSTGQIFPAQQREITVVTFLVSMCCYSAALLPLWRRHRDGLRIALAIPYGAVVIGLFVACADGAGDMMPVLAVYAVALAVMVFLAAGAGTLTWIGGTLFLVSNSLLAIDWFLPGASVEGSTVLVMATYLIGHALIIAGMIRSMPQLRWMHRPAGAWLVVADR